MSIVVWIVVLMFFAVQHLYLLWEWSSLLKGNNLTGKKVLIPESSLLTGKLFNQPPGDPRVYCYYEAPLEDPWDDESDNNLLVQKLQKYGLRSLPRSDDFEQMINLLLFDKGKEWAKLFKPYTIEADSEEGSIRSEKDAKSSLKNEEENSSNDSRFV